MKRSVCCVAAALAVAGCGDPGRAPPEAASDAVSAPRVTRVAELRDPIEGAHGGFGRALAMADATLAVSEPSRWGGHVHAYGIAESRWVHEAILEPSVPGEWTGWKIAAGPGRIVLASGGLTGGSVSVFERTGGAWLRAATIAAPSDATWFGSAVALSGDRMLVAGGRGTSGAVWAYERGVAGWALRQELVSPSPRSPDGWGTSVALSAKWAVVTDPTVPPPSGQGAAGAAFVYQNAGGAWVPSATISEPAALAPFARAATLEGDLLALSALTGSVVHLWSLAGGAPAEEVEVFEAEPSLSSGHSVAVGKNALVVSGMGEPVGGIEQRGEAHLYARTPAGWAGPYPLDPGEEAGAFEHIGDAVAAHDDVVAVAATGAEEPGDEEDYGEVYVFQLARVR